MLQHHTGSRQATAVSPEERERAHRFLSHAATPRQMRAVVKHSESPAARYLAALDFIRTAIEIGRPLPPALDRRLRPWIREIERRRQGVLRYVRYSGARWRAIEHEEAQRRQIEQEAADVAGEKGAAK